MRMGTVETRLACGRIFHSPLGTRAEGAAGGVWAGGGWRGLIPRDRIVSALTGPFGKRISFPSTRRKVSSGVAQTQAVLLSLAVCSPGGVEGRGLEIMCARNHTPS